MFTAVQRNSRNYNHSDCEAHCREHLSRKAKFIPRAQYHTTQRQQHAIIDLQFLISTPFSHMFLQKDQYQPCSLYPSLSTTHFHSVNPSPQKDPCTFSSLSHSLPLLFISNQHTTHSFPPDSSFQTKTHPSIAKSKPNPLPTHTLILPPTPTFGFRSATAYFYNNLIQMSYKFVLSFA